MKLPVRAANSPRHGGATPSPERQARVASFLSHTASTNAFGSSRSKTFRGLSFVERPESQFNARLSWDQNNSAGTSGHVILSWPADRRIGSKRGAPGAGAASNRATRGP